MFIGKTIYGSHKYYTDDNNTAVSWANQSARAWYTDQAGQEQMVNHNHNADVDIPPGGSEVNGF